MANVDVTITVIENDRRLISINDKFAALFVAGLLQNEVHYLHYDPTHPIGVPVSNAEATLLASALANTATFTYAWKPIA